MARKEMKILLSSYAFYPSVGGLEAASAMLAEQFVSRGHEVIIVTNTVGDCETSTYKVVRRPTKSQLFDLVRWCDVFVHNNINLRSAWPLLLLRRPWVVINSGSVVESAAGRCKRFCARFAATSGVSEDAARSIGAKTVIPNCYDNEVFRELPNEKRDGELMFLGRLVGEKGVDVLLRALHQLKLGGMTPRLTIVGGGPEEASLRKLTSSLGVHEQVTFAGVRRDEALVRELNHHKILVAPSTYHEAFGIVALEGIACGCVVVGSERGGLREAIGPCGMTFPNGDAGALAKCLRELLCDAGRIGKLRERAAEHLAGFTKEHVGDAYLKMLSRLCRSAEVDRE